MVRVIAGEFQGARGPARTFTPINVWDLRLSAAGEVQLKLPEGQTVLLIVQAGVVRMNDESLKAVELASLDRQGELAALKADSDARVLLLSGEPLKEPVVGQGPFVMNTHDQIREAFQDYQAGRMGRLT